MSDEMRDMPEGLKELISRWENGELSVEILSMLSAYRPQGRPGAGMMGACAKEPLGQYAKKKLPVECQEAPDHHSLHEQREELHDIFLGIRVQADNAREILTVLDGFIAGGYEGGIKECDAKEASIAHDMPMIIRGLRAQEAVLARTLAGIRCAVDGGPSHPEGYSDKICRAEE